jgi:hypothetical protein
MAIGIEMVLDIIVPDHEDRGAASVQDIFDSGSWKLLPADNKVERWP